MTGLRRWLFAGAAIAALAVVLVGALVGGTPGRPPSGPASPTYVASPAVAPSAAVQPPQQTASPVAVDPDRDRIRVHFARDRLPPFGTYIGGIFDAASAEGRILSRINELRRASAGEVPAGTTNPVALLGTFEGTSQGSRGSFEVFARVQGDVATVEFGRAHFERIRGAAVTQAVVQQLVYAITEEPGVTKARIVEKGATTATIDQLVLDKPLTREDVSGYRPAGSDTSVTYEGGAVPVATEVVSTRVTNEAIPGLGRFTAELRIPGGGMAGTTVIPRLAAKVTDVGGRRILRLDLPDTAAPSPKIPFEEFASGPIRSVDSPHTRTPSDVGAIFLLELDDLRPWRVTREPSATGTIRVNVDVGGRPEWVNTSIAVYSADAGPSGITVRGAARVFEANVSWRMKDASGRTIERGNTTASIGTSPVWGTFQFTTPPAPTAPVTLDVYWASPRDGTEQDVITLAFGVR